MGQREEGHVAARLAHLARSEYHSEETSLLCSIAMSRVGWLWGVGCSVKMPFIILGSTDRPTDPVSFVRDGGAEKQLRSKEFTR